MSPATARPRWATPDDLARDVHRQVADTDSMAHQLEERVTALEEVLAARWPRRWLLAGRLGRSLRASAAPYTGPDFPGFQARRMEAAGEAWLARQEARRRRAGGRP